MKASEKEVRNISTLIPTFFPSTEAEITKREGRDYEATEVLLERTKAEKGKVKKGKSKKT